MSEPVNDVFFVFLYSMQGHWFGVGNGDLLVCSETLHADLPTLRQGSMIGDMGHQCSGIAAPV